MIEQINRKTQVTALQNSFIRTLTGHNLTHPPVDSSASKCFPKLRNFQELETATSIDSNIEFFVQTIRMVDKKGDL